MIKAVIFDLDGTIANTNELIINSFHTIYRKYHNRDCDVEYIIGTFGEPLRTTIQREFSEYPLEEVLATYRSYQHEKFSSEVKSYDKTCEILEHLTSNNIKIGLATSRLSESTENALNMLDRKSVV